MFDGTPLTSIFDNIRRALVAEVKNLKPEDLSSDTDDELSKLFLTKYTQSVPKLIVENKEMLEPSEVNFGMYQKGLSFTICVPYEGNQNFFTYTPSTMQYSSRGVNIKIESNELKFNYTFPTNAASQLETNFEQDLRICEHNLLMAKNEVNLFHSSLPQLISSNIKNRREEVAAQKLVLGSFKIPIRRRSDAPETYNIPEIRRKPQVITHQSSKTLPTQDPALELVEYEHILNIIKDMSLAMERSPKTFAKLSEEEIRDFFLILLNGHYEGGATSETFNGLGKTDILIRYKNANVFIGECKIWGGPKLLTETINQLLRYVTWRDTKTSIIIFNKGKDLTKVLEQIQEIVKSHQNYKTAWIPRVASLNKESIFGFKLSNPADKKKELFLTILAFQVTPQT